MSVKILSQKIISPTIYYVYMDLQREYEIVLKFDTLQELDDFSTEMDEFKEFRINKIENKLNDKRG